MGNSTSNSASNSTRSSVSSYVSNSARSSVSNSARSSVNGTGYSGEHTGTANAASRSMSNPMLSNVVNSVRTGTPVSTGTAGTPGNTSRNFRLQSVYGQSHTANSNSTPSLVSKVQRQPQYEPRNAPVPPSNTRPVHHFDQSRDTQPVFGYRSGANSSSSSLSSASTNTQYSSAPQTRGSGSPLNPQFKKPMKQDQVQSAPSSRQTSVSSNPLNAPPIPPPLHNLRQMQLNRSVPNLTSMPPKHKKSDSYHSQLSQPPVTIHSLASSELLSMSTQAPPPPSLDQTQSQNENMSRRSPKFQRVLSGLSDRISSRGSNRTNTPNLMSRLSSRLSSRVGTPGSVKSVASHRSTTTTTSSTLAEPVLDPVEDNWEPYTPELLPPLIVAQQVLKLLNPTKSLVDIDLSLANMPQQMKFNSLEVREEELKEMKALTHRGLYLPPRIHEQIGHTDSEGQYKEVLGEQIGYRYTVEGKLGVGSFGSVLKCRDHKTGRLVAVKMTTNLPRLQAQAKLEASILRSLIVEHGGHPDAHHFVRYIEHFKFRGHLCIASEILGPNLYEILKRNEYKGLNEEVVKYFSRQLVSALDFLSECGIIHCDLKPENILVSDFDNCQVKIIDFGSGCYENKKLFTYIQSRFYRSPEILLGMHYGVAIDMWSLGTVIVELFLGTPLFPSCDEMDQVALICQVLGIPPRDVLVKGSRSHLFLYPNGYPLKLRNEKGVNRMMPGTTPLHSLMQRYSPLAVDFCLQMLRWLPDYRATPKSALAHPFLNQ